MRQYPIIAGMMILLLVNMDMLACYRGPGQYKQQQLSGQQQQQQPQVSSWRSPSLQLLLQLMKYPIQQQQQQEENHSRIILYSNSIPSIDTAVDTSIQTIPKAVSTSADA